MVTTPLRERMRSVLRTRNYSSRTEETYLEAVARFARHFGKSPEQLGAAQITEYQVWLRETRHVSASLFNQVVCALRFLYVEVLNRPDEVVRVAYARTEKHLPVVLSVEETARFLGSIEIPRYRVLLTTIYSAGLRLGEALALRAGDIDSSRMLIRIRQGKGKKDRYALRAIGACRTPALGGTRQQCDHCGHEHIQWHSCRNRSCPRCQASARRAWLDARQAELLPVPYFHVVFTVPEELNVLALHAPRVFYDLLFRAVGATLTDVARSRLKAQIGALCVLHTWGQTLVLHPHIHCVIPGGGFSAGHSRWLSTRKPTFLLPVRVLSRRFRTLLCSALREVWHSGKLEVPAAIVADSVALDLLLARASAKELVVYAKAPFGGPAQVLGYLANYTHRIAISNSRIVSFNGQDVCFRYRDYAHGNQPKIMSLTAGEFLRRFLLHVVPRRFVRIRYYGFMANRVRSNNLTRARQLIGDKTITLTQQDPRPDEHRCPRCKEGFMREVECLVPSAIAPSYEDTS